MVVVVAVAADASPVKYGNDSYVRDNVSILHIYFKKLHFMQRERGELYGFIDFFSNIGGVLGLCMGFSMLSAVEIVYFFTIRFVCNMKMKREEDFD